MSVMLCSQLMQSLFNQNLLTDFRGSNEIQAIAYSAYGHNLFLEQFVKHNRSSKPFFMKDAHRIGGLVGASGIAKDGREVRQGSGRLGGSFGRKSGNWKQGIKGRFVLCKSMLIVCRCVQCTISSHKFHVEKKVKLVYWCIGVLVY